MSGKPAARLGDKTDHGGVIVEGAETVLIGGKPAARLTDDHKCGKKRHSGGPVLAPCSPTVLVEGKPAARISDKAACRGPDDTIVEGETTVLIGAQETAGAAPAAVAVSDKGRAVLVKYQKQLEQQLDVSAKEMALQGILTKQPSPEFMLSWTQGMLMDLPLCDTPMGQALGDMLGLTEEQRKLNPKEVGKQLGKKAGDKAKAWAESFRADHPGWFWSAAVLAGLGAGALTYSEGTGVLKKVGVEPKVSKKFFGDKVKLDGAFEMGKKLKDPKFNLAAEEQLGKSVKLWQKAEVSGEDFGSLRLKKYSLGAEEKLGESVKLTQQVEGTDAGLTKYSLGAEERLGKSLKLWQKAEGTPDGLSKYSLGADYTPLLSDPNHKLSMGAAYSSDMTANTDRVSAYLRGNKNGLTYGAEGWMDPGASDYQVQGYAGKKFSDNGVIEGFVQQRDVGGVQDTAAGFRLRFSW